MLYGVRNNVRYAPVKVNRSFPDIRKTMNNTGSVVIQIDNNVSVFAMIIFFIVSRPNP